MTCGFLPFEDPNTNKLYKKILACDYTIPSSLSPELKDLTKKILNTDPNKRLSIGDIRAHEWYTKIRSVEMDGVIVVEPTTMYESPDVGPRGVYVALTRSTQQLVVVHSRELPQELRD